MKTKLLLIVFLLNVSYILIAQIIHVPGDQPTIQDGINAANNGDTVLVAEDTYFENINFRGKAITVASHYITDIDTTHINNTIINGSQPSYPDSASVVSFISGEDTTSVISGFTITGGGGLIFPSAATRAGGGIICWNSGVSILNNKIIENEVSFQSNAYGGGIAASNSGGSFLIVIENNLISNNSVSSIDFVAAGGGLDIEMNSQLKNNIIENNTCESELLNAYGGGIYCLSEEGLMYDFKFINNTINNNHAYGNNVYGGGVYALWSALCMSGNEINNNYLSGDKAWGAGLFIRSAGDIELSENEISNNSIDVNEFWVGCGIYINYPETKTEIIKNVITGNTGNAVSNALGGGISISNSSDNQILLDGNIFSDNNAFAGGAIYAKDVLNCHLTNNVFANNSGDLSGGAVYMAVSSKEDDANNSTKSNLDNKTDTTHFVLANNTFFNNTAGGNGGAVRNWNLEEIIIFNNIFWENEAAAGSDVHNASFFEMNISYSNIDTANIEGPWTGSDNMNEDPIFIDPENGDFHLDNNSPCAGVGTDSLEINEVMFYCPSYDFENDPRPMPYTYPPDMGADEVEEINPSTSEIVIPITNIELSNYPNPFSYQTNINFNIKHSDFIRLSIVDFTGKEIQTLVSQYLQTGKHTYEWNAEGFPSGIYFMRLETNGISKTRKIVLMD